MDPDALATIPDVDIIGRLNSVEIVWRQSFQDPIFEQRLGSKTYRLSNDQGAWQSQLVYADACPDCVEPYPVWILGSADATRVAPYLRRVAGDWQIPAPVPPYDDPFLAAIGSDDRSYLVQVVESGHFLVWQETDDGCHVPVWRLQSGSPAQCRTSKPNGAAVDGDGVLHLTGSEQLSESEWQIVHWKVGSDDVERHEVAPLPEGLASVERPLHIDESGAFHTCYPPLLNEGVTIYAHGHDANDLVEVHLDDPGFHPQNEFDLMNTSCNLVLAPDGTPWLTWATIPSGEFRVAFIENDVPTYEVVDFGVGEESVELTLDSLSRPWLVGVPPAGFDQELTVAHRDGGMWLVEQVSFP